MTRSTIRSRWAIGIPLGVMAVLAAAIAVPSAVGRAEGPEKPVGAATQDARLRSSSSGKSASSRQAEQVAGPTEPASVDESGVAWLPAEQADAAWTAETNAFPEALPLGRAFPRKAPPFFDPVPGAGESQLYEDGLIQTFVAEFWYCAWLGELASAPDGHRSTRDLQRLAAKYESLRDPRETVDLSVRLAQRMAVAGGSARGAAAAEYDAMECNRDWGEGTAP